MTTIEMYNVLIHYADADYLQTLNDAEMTALYNSMFEEE